MGPKLSNHENYPFALLIEHVCYGSYSGGNRRLNMNVSENCRSGTKQSQDKERQILFPICDLCAKKKQVHSAIIISQALCQHCIEIKLEIESQTGDVNGK